MPHPAPEKIVGIIGGMGPEATVDLMQRVIRLTPAKDDADHIRCFVDNNPKVPSRIKALIEGTGESPGPTIAAMAKNLESWGADFIAIPCNTAHYYHAEAQAAVRIPVLNLMELVVAASLRRIPGLRTVGLLASPAVRMIELYERYFRAEGAEVIYPEQAQEKHLLEAIKDVKMGNAGEEPRRAMRDAADNLARHGADLAVIACTELSVIADPGYSLPHLDAAEVLAEAIVTLVKGRRKFS